MTAKEEIVQIRRFVREKGSRLCFRRHTRCAVALTVGVGYLIDAIIASAAEAAASQVQVSHFPVGRFLRPRKRAGDLLRGSKSVRNGSEISTSHDGIKVAVPLKF
jgi:hypothetical protein